MSTTKYILRIILILVSIIQLLVLSILAINNPLPETLTDFTILFRNLSVSILVVFILAIICFIIEHKIYNKNEGVLDENLISPAFDISFKNNDILYLSTILNQRYPGKRDLILLIMQLICKKVIDLSSYFDGTNYQYIIEKRENHMQEITNLERDILNYLFNNTNRVNLINKIKEMYSIKNKKTFLLEQKCYKYIELLKPQKESCIKIVYQLLTVILSLLVFFLGICILLVTLPIMESIMPIEVIIKFVLIATLCIFIAFFYTLILKKFTQDYQYNNDTCIWIFKNVTMLSLSLMVGYIFPSPQIAHFFIIITYIFTMLTIMIKYNRHFSLTQSEITLRTSLISLKKYFKNMNYLEDKEFANITTYEECIMYGFLLDITIKINKEFDLLQKELLKIVQTEGILYFKLFKTSIDRS